MAEEDLPGLERLAAACGEKKEKLDKIQGLIHDAEVQLHTLRRERRNPVQLARRRLILAEIQLNLGVYDLFDCIKSYSDNNRSDG